MLPPTLALLPVLTVVSNKIKKRHLIPIEKERLHKESPIVGLRERLNLILHLQAIQMKQCASTATQRGIGSVAAQKDKITDSTLSELDKPANYNEAMASPEAAKWKEHDNAIQSSK
ncbi:hypothetical protein Tco_0811950 [Tanacetum coccineum]